MNSTIRKALLVAALIVLVAQQGTAQARVRAEWTFHDLGALPGHTSSRAYAINNHGQVVGVSESSAGSYAVVWNDGVISDLGTLGAQQLAMAVAMNDNGQIVGSSLADDGVSHAVLWEQGRMIDLGTFGGLESAAYGINNRGQIVGQFVTADGDSHAFLRDQGKVTDLGPAGANTAGLAINARGDVAGIGYFMDADVNLGVVWQRGVLTQLPLLRGDREGYASAINNRGQIVGTSIGEQNRAVLWSADEVTPLELARSEASAINDRGHVVGHWRPTMTSGASAFVWERGHAVTLTIPSPYESWAVDINNQGQVAGVAMLANGETHAVLWTP